MFNWRQFAASVIVLAMLQARPCDAATEMEQRTEIMGAAERAFLDDDFNGLEKTASAYRREKARTASGLWKLTVFYAGIEEGIEGFAREHGGVDAYDALKMKTRQWIEAYPDTPTGHIANAMVLVEQAWAHRGSGYASTVSAENWAKFKERIADARAYLQKHKAVASSDPRWYEMMIGVARDQAWTQAQFDALLEEALDREPQFYQTYFSAYIYLMPRWHGDIEKIEDFAQYAVRKTSALEGQGMYARIYWYASQSEFKNDLFTESLVEWPQMKAGFEDIISRYPDAWNLNNYARFACLAGDKAKTAELMTRIGSAVVSEAWRPVATKGQCAEWASRP